MRIFLIILLSFFGLLTKPVKTELLLVDNKILEDQKDIIIISDIQTNDNKNGVFSAIGNVKITYPFKQIVATSNSAKYIKEDNKIILNGNVKLIKENAHSILAEEIVFFIGEDKIIANSKSESQVFTKLLFSSLTKNKIVD